MKLLYLNSLILIPSDKGKQRIEKALGRNKSGVKTDEHGNTREFYEELGVKIPEGFFEEDNDDFEDDIDEDGNMFLKPDEMEYDYSDLVLSLDSFSSVVDDEELGSILTTKNGKEFHIEETAEQVYAYILVINRSWFTKIKNYIQLKLTRSTNTQKLN